MNLEECVLFHKNNWTAKVNFIISNTLVDVELGKMSGNLDTRIVRKINNVCAYNPRSCFIVPDQSCGVFSRV